MLLKILTKNSPDAIEFSEKVKKIAEEMGFKITEENDQDYVLVIGGDGTFLKAVKFNSPIIGIKFGRRSALLDVNPENVKDVFTRLIKGEYTVEEYVMLDIKTDQIRAIAFNEVAILFDNPETILGSVIIHDKKVTFEGDGVLVSTPQGSWAWSYSATRTLLHRDINGLEITFMNCIIPDVRNIIIPIKEKIRVKLENKGRPQIAKVVVDGEVVGYLRSGEDEEAMITQHDRKAKILRFYRQINLGYL
ncbi:NAD(+)/NADH kinase [Stygiolobus caldivivus]|uniref:NAD(+) kinase n=1 Tax=Stygiolobus caldivivus TaxID=2824673 RepID=A0A8D5U4R5_9CREN|nr:NAD(+)/NADH kinase [Stygiolobus caldivivus]BCU69259.1 NAD(+) kinase [Stygiolobus caldivivus]